MPQRVYCEKKLIKTQRCSAWGRSMEGIFSWHHVCFDLNNEERPPIILLSPQLSPLSRFSFGTDPASWWWRGGSIGGLSYWMFWLFGTPKQLWIGPWRCQENAVIVFSYWNKRRAPGPVNCPLGKRREGEKSLECHWNVFVSAGHLSVYAHVKVRVERWAGIPPASQIQVQGRCVV